MSGEQGAQLGPQVGGQDSVPALPSLPEAGCLRDLPPPGEVKITPSLTPQASCVLWGQNVRKKALGKK